MFLAKKPNNAAVFRIGVLQEVSNTDAEVSSSELPIRYMVKVRTICSKSFMQ